MQEKICLVTGANSGLGYGAAYGLANQGAHVVMLCRSAKRGDAARADLIARTGSQSIDLMIADLASQDSIRQFAADFSQRYPRLDVLINNAGVNTSKRSQTADGLELIFGVNYIAPFLLTHLLLDCLHAAASSGEARVINVSSMAHARWIDWGNLQAERFYYHWLAYAYSKLCLLMFTRELAQRLEGTRITVNACHPGMAQSNIGRDYRGIWHLGDWLGQRIAMKTREEGAEVMVYLASSPEVSGVTGRYFGPTKKEERMPRIARNDAALRRLWDLSTKLAGLEP